MLCETEVEEHVYDRFIRTTSARAVNFMELGAGHGFQSMKFLMYWKSLAAITTIERVYCMLVEPYPPHFTYLMRNMNGHNCKLIFGAVAERSGASKFLGEWQGKQGKDFWGGQLTDIGELEVRTYTIYEIMEMADIEYITLLHMDIQGAEEQIAEHCLDLALRNKLENIYVGTHGQKRHDYVKEKLSPHIKLLIDAPPNSISNTPLGYTQTRDGILFFSNTINLAKRAAG